MTGEVLIDTNVVVYAYHDDDRDKQSRARQILDRLSGNQLGRLSTQVLGEVFRVLTGKRRPTVPVTDAVVHLEALARLWPVYVITPVVVIEAARGVRDHQLNFWDAQIWATARLNQVPTILTEDAPPRGVLEGVRYLNPFAPAFDPTTLA